MATIDSRERIITVCCTLVGEPAACLELVDLFANGKASRELIAATGQYVARFPPSVQIAGHDVMIVASMVATDAERADAVVAVARDTGSALESLGELGLLPGYDVSLDGAGREDAALLGIFLPVDADATGVPDDVLVFRGADGDRTGIRNAMQTLLQHAASAITEDSLRPMPNWIVGGFHQSDEADATLLSDSAAIARPGARVEVRVRLRELLELDDGVANSVTLRGEVIGLDHMHRVTFRAEPVDAFPEDLAGTWRGTLFREPAYRYPWLLETLEPVA